jgi:Prealbumin-like fold domain
MKTGLVFKLSGASLVSLALLVLGGTAGAKDKPGQGKGREKVVLCHKGMTIRVARPAVRAHLRHGDTLGPCTAPAPHRATLTVFKNVINDNGGTKTAADFTITINGVTAIGGNTFPGSTTGGVTLTLATVGSYSVTEAAVPGYALTSASAECSGTIALGEHKTCVLVNNDAPS